MHSYCPKSIPFGPLVVERIIEALPDDVMDTPTHPDRFTPREVVAHQAFWEQVIQWRIKQALNEDDPEVPNWDEDADAIENNYKELDIQHMLAKWRQGRAETMALLESLPPESWKRTFRHPQHGHLTIDDAANLIIAHDMYHVEQLAGLLAG